MSNFYTEPFVSAGEMEFPSEPYITAQPQNHTATGPEEYVLKVIAAGAVSYQWEVFDGESWSTIPGATSDTLTITIDSSMNGWRYRVLVTGADGSTVVSKAAQIAVKGVHEITLEGAIVTFTGPARIKSLEVEINAVQSGSGDPSPTNIRPISGWDTVNVFVRGINQWDEEWRNGYYNESTGAFVPNSAYVANKNPIPALPNTTYYGVEASSYVDNFLCYDAEMNYLGTATRNSDGTRVTKPNTAYINFRTRQAYGGTYNNDISVNYPSTDTDYHAYNGTTYPITLPNTCYGGTIKDGVLTGDRGYVDLGTLNWAFDALQGIFSAPVPNFAPPSDYLSRKEGFICSMYPADTQISISGSMTDKTALRLGGNIYIKDLSYTDVESFKAMLTANNAQLVYELETPIEITLSDWPTITLLSGINNMWADSGDIQVTIIR